LSVSVTKPYELLYPLLLDPNQQERWWSLNVSVKESGFPGAFGDIPDNRNLSEGEFFQITM